MSNEADTTDTPRRTASEVALAEHVELLADILAAREAGNFDTLHGNGDEDLIYATEEVRDAIPPILAVLKG